MVKPVLDDDVKAALELRSAKNDARPRSRGRVVPVRALGEVEEAQGIHSR
jgi:hypothetical protein